MITLASALKTILQSPSLHGRFLNTLSYLEYVGFRKIVKSQESRRLGPSVLLHAAEEARHAAQLKKLALRVGGEALSSYEPSALLSGFAAEDYFQTLDQGVLTSLKAQLLDAEGRARLVYAYVTWLVERRALQVYGAYMTEAAALSMPTHFAGLLKEEDGHLREMQTTFLNLDPRGEENQRELLALEARLFGRFLQELARELRTTANHALA